MRTQKHVRKALHKTGLLSAASVCCVAASSLHHLISTSRPCLPHHSSILAAKRLQPRKYGCHAHSSLIGMQALRRARGLASCALCSASTARGSAFARCGDASAPAAGAHMSFCGLLHALIDESSRHAKEHLGFVCAPQAALSSCRPKTCHCESGCVRWRP